MELCKKDHGACGHNDSCLKAAYRKGRRGKVILSGDMCDYCVLGPRRNCQMPCRIKLGGDHDTCFRGMRLIKREK